MIVASLVPRMSACVQNIRDFPQAKLDSKINAYFLLNKHGDPHFLMHEFKLHKVISI